MAFHEERQFDALTKLCHALDHFVDDHARSWRPGPKEWINVQTYYPVLIVQGDLLDVRRTRGRFEVRSVNQVQFRRSSVVRGEERKCQLDVITERHLGRFLSLVDREIMTTARATRRRGPAVVDSVKRLQRKLRALKSLDRMRVVLKS
jgi:hypothetical protein